MQESIQAEEQPLAWHGLRLRSQLETLVQDCLPQAEPVGVYLSGGLDSRIGYRPICSRFKRLWVQRRKGGRRTCIIPGGSFDRANYCRRRIEYISSGDLI